MAGYEDRKLTCKDCGEEFVFSAGEQEHHDQLGLRNEPRRCPICRQVARMKTADRALLRGSRRAGPPPGAGAPPPRGGGFNRGPDRREGPPPGRPATFTVKCAQCGRMTDVPFKPTGIRPVYCRDCFRARR